MAACGLYLALGGVPSARAEERTLRLAHLPLPADELPAPQVEPPTLGTADLVRYREIFLLQHRARWAEADRLITALDDPMLLGHVLAARYLDGSRYPVGYAELATWLERYADLPEGESIYRLAQRLQPPGAPAPSKPIGVRLRAQDTKPVARAAALKRPREQWTQALAAWRKGAFAAAGDRFAQIAAADGQPAELQAAAAFWAARARLRSGQPQLATRYLRQAARADDGFYGALAQEQLNGAVAFSWYDRQTRETALDLALRYPAVQRAVALTQVGQRQLAGAELQRVAAQANDELAENVIVFALRLRVPGADQWLARRMRDSAGSREQDELPLPRWAPAGGYQLDPALVHAVIRAESGFDPTARSASGALGLMQVMPETAQIVARSLRVAYGGERWLLQPATNMKVGQAWMVYLAGSKAINNSLIHVIAAYNAGEGRITDLAAGELKVAADDPLLYIESMPIAETRNYIKRVLANLWAYQASDGREIPSLRALAENRWPEMPLGGTVAAAALERRPDARAN
ncbi:MAG: lytic transglycosylase domain-containing protein [Geminicoccaceae bacterium]